MIKLNEIKRRIRRWDLLDFSMVKTIWVLAGIILATYISPLRGFVEQNIGVVIFLIIVIAIKPMLKFFKK